MTQREILITGAAGFIGYHLARTLQQEPRNRLTLVDNFKRGRLDDNLQELCAQPNVTFHRLDLLDEASFRELNRKYDEVYHLAALLGVENVVGDPTTVLKVNAVMTLKLLEWCVSAGTRKLFFSSTSEVYAWTQQFYPLPVPTPEDVPLALTDLANPRSTYAASKIFGELAVRQYCKSADIPFVIARYHNVYGPRMGNDHVVPQLYKRVIDGQRPLVVYSADHVRAFCFIDDAISASIAAMRTPAATNETINIGNDSEEITIRKLAERIVSCANVDASLEPRMADNDPIKRRCPDLSKARRLLGYNPSVSLSQGLQATLGWYSKMLSQV